MKSPQQVNLLFSGSVVGTPYNVNPFEIGGKYAAAIQVNGNLAGGTGKIQGSLDGDNWDDLAGTSVLLAGTTQIWDLSATAVPYVRLVLIGLAGIDVEVLGTTKG